MGVLIIRILLFRVLYQGSLFSETPICCSVFVACATIGAATLDGTAMLWFTVTYSSCNVMTICARRQTTSKVNSDMLCAIAAALLVSLGDFFASTIMRTCFESDSQTTIAKKTPSAQ